MKKILFKIITYLLLLFCFYNYTNAYTYSQIDNILQKYYHKIDNKYSKIDKKIQILEKINKRVDSILEKKKNYLSNKNRELLGLVKKSINNKIIFYKKELNKISLDDLFSDVNKNKNENKNNKVTFGKSNVTNNYKYNFYCIQDSEDLIFCKLKSNIHDIKQIDTYVNGEYVSSISNRYGKLGNNIDNIDIHFSNLKGLYNGKKMNISFRISREDGSTLKSKENIYFYYKRSISLNCRNNLGYRKDKNEFICYYYSSELNSYKMDKIYYVLNGNKHILNGDNGNISFIIDKDSEIYVEGFIGNDKITSKKINLKYQAYQLDFNCIETIENHISCNYNIDTTKKISYKIYLNEKEYKGNIKDILINKDSNIYGKFSIEGISKEFISNKYYFKYKSKESLIPKFCNKNINGANIYLKNCLLKFNIKRSDGNKNFVFTVISDNKEISKDYDIVIYGYGEGFPTYGILGGGSNGFLTSGQDTFDRYFDLGILKKDNYFGYIKIIIYDDDNKKYELRQYIDLKIKD